MIHFVPSDGMKIHLLPEQEGFLSSKAYIRSVIGRADLIALDIFSDGQLIGFAMLRRYEEDNLPSPLYFLWDYAIDSAFQGQGLGKAALIALISFMQEQHHLHTMTTTYVWGNDIAKNLYESVGFVETDVVDEPDCHEVNMIFSA